MLNNYSQVHFIDAPAKLNLFLNIVGSRQDSYHDLQSIFCKINLFDKISINKSNKFSLKISGEFSSLIDLENNLFTQIFNFFSKNFILDSQVNIDLEKNIPVGAGLGGGSSDGANFIKIINKIFDLNLAKAQMQKIALNFGSDLPFFFEDEICFVEGRGEIISDINDISVDFARYFRANLAKRKIILINPKINLATAKIFQKFSQKIKANNLSYTKKIDKNELINLSFEDIVKNNGNDLENIAIEIYPALLEILQNLQKFAPLSAKMSGSGSSFFAIFDDTKNFNDCLNFFTTNYPQYFVREVSLI